MPLKTRKIDYRNQLFGIMHYQISCTFPKFFEIRSWCWSSFGPGIEYEHFINYTACTNQTLPWAWDCSKYQGASLSSGKIYLPNDKDMFNLFSLTWL